MMMKTRLKTLLIVFISFFAILHSSSCVTDISNTDKKEDSDAEVEEIVKEYKYLAKNKNINFKNNVSIQFKRIKDESTVGITRYWISGKRTITIDKDFWKKSTKTTRITLLFHELTHAYCYRDHSYKKDGKLKPYDDKRKDKDGFYKESSNCPLSIMYPSLLSDSCVIAHYSDYVSEMFEGCEPY